jgi:hypothetical protein
VDVVDQPGFGVIPGTPFGLMRGCYPAVESEAVAPGPHDAVGGLHDVRSSPSASRPV